LRKCLFYGLLLFSNFNFAQQNYFNHRINFEKYDNGFGVIVSDSSYILFDHYLDSNLNSGFKIIKMDWNLSPYSIKQFTSNQYDLFGGLPGGFEMTSDSLFYFSGYKSTDAGQMIFYAFNYNGDSIWTSEFGDSLYQAGWQAKRTRDNGFIVVIRSKTYNGVAGVSLVKLDSIGSILWTRDYPHLRFESAISIDTTYDGGFILGGGTLNSFGIPANSQCLNVYCIKTDSVGNIQWNKSFGGPYYDVAWRVIQTKDSNYVMAGIYTESDPTPPTMCADGYGLTRPYIIKLNQNGDTMWTRRYGEAVFNTGIRVLRELDNGDLIAAGQYHIDSTNNELGLILKVNNNGDSLWYKTYWNLISPGSLNALYDIRQTPDMGFVACGYTGPRISVQDTGHQDTWILKIDSNGCEVANCVVNTTIDEESALIFTIYPNPSSGRFTILSNGSIIRELTVYDQLGKQIIAQKGNIKEINLENFANGIYFYRVECASKVLTGRLVKQ
jgi:hypothetical protein